VPRGAAKRTQQRLVGGEGAGLAFRRLPTPLTVGVRVRVRRGFPGAVDAKRDHGWVKRLDARGALVMLDDGTQILVEPLLVIVVDWTG